MQASNPQCEVPKRPSQFMAFLRRRDYVVRGTDFDTATQWNVSTAEILAEEDAVA